jgi:hypothetical protein
MYDLTAPKGPLPCYRYGRKCIRFLEADLLTYQNAHRREQEIVQLHLKDPQPIPKLKVRDTEPLNCFEQLGIKIKPKLSEQRKALSATPKVPSKQAKKLR